MHTTSGILAACTALLVSCGPAYPNCDNDDDCHGAEVCVNGQCQQCGSDADCGPGQTCRGGACEVIPGYCSSSGQCPNGEECRQNRCTAATEVGEALPEPDLAAGPCNLAPVYFAFDADALDGSARAAVQANLACLRERNVARAHVTGLCDPRGTEEYNLALGDRRARGVRDYMVSLGADRAGVSASSMGEEMARGTDEGSYGMDRRVDFAAQAQ